MISPVITQNEIIFIAQIHRVAKADAVALVE